MTSIIEQQSSMLSKMDGMMKEKQRKLIQLQQKKANV